MGLHVMHSTESTSSSVNHVVGEMYYRVASGIP